MPAKECEAIKALSPRRGRLATILDFARFIMSLLPIAEPVKSAVDALTFVISVIISGGALIKGDEKEDEEKRGIVRKVISWISDRGKAQFISSLAQFLKSVNEAWLYLNNEGCRDVVNEVAGEWGMDAESFRSLIGNLRNLTAGRLITEEELREKLDELWWEIVKGDLGKYGFNVYLLRDFEKGAYPNVTVINGRLMVRTIFSEGVGLKGMYVGVVTAGAFENAAFELAKRLRGGGLTVVIGPRGIGKSTLAALVLWRALNGGEVNAVVSVSEVNANSEEHLENLLNRCRGDYAAFCGRLVILYDPSSIEEYKVPTNIKATSVGRVEETLRYLTPIAKQTPVIVVLPSDVANVLSEDLRKYIEGYSYTPNLKDEEFISEVVKEYSGCAINEDKLREIVKNILNFDEGHALIARLIGEEVRRNNCEVKTIEDLLRRAGGNAMAFIVNYINMFLHINEKRVEKFPRLLPIRQLFVQLKSIEPDDYIMPSGLVRRWLKCKGIYRNVEYPRGEELKKTVSRWLAQKHHSLIEGALELITLASTIDVSSAPESLRQRLEFMINAPQPLRDALDPWMNNEEKLPSDIAEKLLDLSKSSSEDVINYFLNEKCSDGKKYGDKLIQELRQKPECWRRLALMAGAAVSRYSFGLLVEAVEDLLKEGRDVFPGLAEAIKPCGIDDILLEGGKPTPFSEILLMFGYDVYKAYSNEWGEVAGELRRLKDTWLRRRGYPFVEAVYALGLAILTAHARRAGQGIDAETAKTALWLASSGVQRVAHPLAVDVVIELLRPLRDHYWSGWASLLDIAANVEITDLVLEELKEIYGHASNLEDWTKARLAYAYVKAGDEEGACSLLNEIRDDVLRILTGAYVYHVLAGTGSSCPNADPCKELEDINQRLGNLEEQASNPREFLKNHPGLEEYLRWYSLRKPEDALGISIKGAHAFALSGLGHCAIGRDELNNAMNYYGKAAEIVRELGHWENYLTYRRRAIGAMALSGVSIEKVISEFESLWGEALQGMELTAPYLSAAAKVLSDYLVALALVGRRGDAEKLLKEHGSLLDEYMDRPSNVATRLTLKYLGVNVDVPSSWEVLEAVEKQIMPELRPAMKEILGIHIPVEDVPSLCRDIEVKNSVLCFDAYAAVNGDKEAEERIKQFIIYVFSEVNAPPELLKLLDRANARQLTEVYAPETSKAQFILLLQALASGDRDLVLLHAEVAHALLRQYFAGKLFGDLADALRSGDENSTRRAVAKLYYYHF